MTNEANKPDEQIKTEYSEGLNEWLKARSDWDSYRRAIDSSNPMLKRLDQFATQLVDLLPPNSLVVDLGFGPEGRDVAFINSELGIEKDVKAIGVELVPENIDSAVNLQRAVGNENSVQGKVAEANIVQGIPLADNSVDGVILSSVIQHMSPDELYEKVIPDVARILKKGGMMYLIFKMSDGETQRIEFVDKMMNGKVRVMNFYNLDEIVVNLTKRGFTLYEGDETHFGGKLIWKDQIRGFPIAGAFFVKR